MREINSVSDLLRLVSTYMPLTVSEHHLRFWLRGQGNSEWLLQPGVYRDGFAPSEMERLRLERHLTQDFRALGAGLLSGSESQAELYFIQQHYGMHTRLLDWTTNPMAALWFAVSDRDSKESNGSIAVMDVYNLLKQQDAYFNDKALKGIGSSRAPYFEAVLKPIFEWKEPCLFPDYIIPIRPDYSKERLGLQRSCFTFHVPTRPVLTSNENDTLQKFTIPRNSKQAIRMELARLGVDSFSIYGDLESLAGKLKYSYGVG